MEPPPFGSGNMVKAWMEANNKTMLQWSHRLSAVETCKFPSVTLSSYPLQWSHRLSAVETWGHRPWHRAPPYGLQWSHRLSAVETTPQQGFTPRQEVTLQWSHRLSAVETPADLTHLEREANGATAFRQWCPGCVLAVSGLVWLQWSHRLSAVETSRLTTAYRARRLRWNLDRLSAVETSTLTTVIDTTCGFNGATAFRQWKRRRTRMNPHRQRKASMEPPPFGSGKRGCSPAPWTRLSRFNGATAFRQWKLHAFGHTVIARDELQWSHRLSAVET